MWTLPYPLPKTLALSDYHRGAKECNTPSEASWLYQRLAIMQLTWYKNILYLHSLCRCLHCIVNGVKFSVIYYQISQMQSLTQIQSLTDIVFNLVILKKIIINNSIYYFSLSQLGDIFTLMFFVCLFLVLNLEYIIVTIQNIAHYRAITNSSNRTT